VLGFAVSSILNLRSVSRAAGGVPLRFPMVARPAVAAAAMGIILTAARAWLLSPLQGGLLEVIGILVLVGLGATIYAVLIFRIGGIRGEDFELVPRLKPWAGKMRQWGLLRDEQPEKDRPGRSV